ncbi:phage holin family protein [Acinetobacter sp. B5B]|uniref:phage holin family protein n=1 Tax=Acinetobacter baretiae TaxID=2605383 RepID=UPI0018C315C9|nr:phage holin family protein [Acinetobacter baretiae]MBF7683867.1 phage holin family protein [Acinetobacter baretiae]
MWESLYSAIAVICYLVAATRILCFDSLQKKTHHNRMHQAIATLLIAAFAGQSINIIFLKDPVTIWDAFFGVVLLAVVLRSKGNIASMFRSHAL